MVRALRDPDGANLDRVQIVKGWLDAAGDPQTRVFDIAWSGDREVGLDGKLPPVGSTVNGADYTNTIGSPALAGYWVDPEFSPTQRAYYYVRVQEIPTPSRLAFHQAFLRATRLARRRRDGSSRIARTPRRSGTRRNAEESLLPLPRTNRQNHLCGFRVNILSWRKAATRLAAVNDRFRPKSCRSLQLP
jgi:hypothetical protein